MGKDYFIRVVPPVPPPALSNENIELIMSEMLPIFFAELYKNKHTYQFKTSHVHEKSSESKLSMRMFLERRLLSSSSVILWNSTWEVSCLQGGPFPHALCYAFLDKCLGYDHGRSLIQNGCDHGGDTPCSFLSPP